MGRPAKDLSSLSPVRRVYLLAGRGYVIAEIAQETGLTERDVRRCLSISRHGEDRIEQREQRRQFVERALITGLASGGTVIQIAAILGDTLPMTNKALIALRHRYGAKTNAHLIALVLAEALAAPCASSQATPVARPKVTMVAPYQAPVVILSGSACPDCGELLRFTEGCEKCHQCGYTRC